MNRAVIFTGGVFHPFDAAAPSLARVLADAGIRADVSFDLDEVLAALRGDPAALLVVYALRWSMTQHEKYAPFRAQWSLKLAPSARAAIAEHVQGGGGLLGVHTASICFDDWPAWRDVLGGAWRWGASHHPPLGPVRASLVRSHALTRGLPDFSVTDEAYSNLDLAAGIEVAAWVEAASVAHPQAGPQPALWTHHFGRGRVVYDALGHDSASLEHPVHRRVLQRAALWASGAPDNVVEAA